jgi:hypothetical protein
LFAGAQHKLKLEQRRNGGGKGDKPPGGTVTVTSTTVSTASSTQVTTATTTRITTTTVVPGPSPTKVPEKVSVCKFGTELSGDHFVPGTLLQPAMHCLICFHAFFFGHFPRPLREFLRFCKYVILLLNNVHHSEHSKMEVGSVRIRCQRIKAVLENLRPFRSKTSKLSRES